MCKMLADKYNLIHRGENYCSDTFLTVAVSELQPNMCYFRTHGDWQKFLNRSPSEYAAWIDNNSREMAEFEIAKLIRISEHKKVIVDTNIPWIFLSRLLIIIRWQLCALHNLCL